MGLAAHHQAMFPIAQIISHQAMRHALTGANAGDPVLPEHPRRSRRRRRPKAQPARAALALKPRGTS
jgi:hypothetical protein